MEANVVSGFLDTSVIVRYLTGHPPKMANRAAKIVDDSDGLQVSDVALVEMAYALSSRYQVPRDVIVDHLSSPRS